MKIIYTKKHKIEILVDDCDFEYLNSLTWHVNGSGYVATHFKIENSKYKHITMHKLILDLNNEYTIDHINRNKLDNRRTNLRICTRSQNTSNKGKMSNNKVGFKGVSYHKASKKYRTQIYVNRKLIFIEYFDSAIQAAKSYDSNIKLFHGDFAVTNEELGYFTKEKLK